MRLGFDMDEVIVNLSVKIAEYITTQFGIEWTQAMFTSYSFTGLTLHHEENINSEIIEELIRIANDPDFQLTAEPVAGACESLNRLKKLGHKIHLVSSRPTQNQPATVKWLRKYSIPFDTIDTIGHNNPKGLYGKKYDLDMFVDDLPKHLESMLLYKKRWRKGLVLFDKPWNGPYYDGSKFVKVMNWQELLRHIGIQKR